MPRILLNGNAIPYSTAPHAVYTVDRAVGRNAPNDRLDVLLVQIYLLLFTENSQWVPPRPPQV